MSDWISSVPLKGDLNVLYSRNTSSVPQVEDKTKWYYIKINWSKYAEHFFRDKIHRYFKTKLETGIREDLYRCINLNGLRGYERAEYIDKCIELGSSCLNKDIELELIDREEWEWIQIV